jgi:hypothetical protein
VSSLATRLTARRITFRFRWWYSIILAAVVIAAAWLVLTQVRVSVTLCGQIIPGGPGVSSCLGSSVHMSLWDYITNSKYPEFSHVLD